ncbi:MAG: hypothetical protein K2I03_06915 [Lachnospiraceae bacterium]|nr:hypothetical protein [Lachnospiraceae bacterium]
MKDNRIVIIFVLCLLITGVSGSRMRDLGFSPDNLYCLKYMLVTDPNCNFSGNMAFGTVYQISVLFVLIGLAVFFFKR